MAVGCIVFMLVDFIASILAIALERNNTTRWQNVRVLSYIWLQRFTYRQLNPLVIFKTLKRVLQGHAFEWGKQERTAAVLYPMKQEVVALPVYADGDTSRTA